MNNHATLSREQRPLYIFITILLLVVLGLTIQTEELYSQPLRLALVCVLLAVHIALHWLVVIVTPPKPGWTSGYIIVQGALAAGLIWFGQEFGLVLAMTAALIGEALGVLGTSRHGLLAVSWYLVVVMGSLWSSNGLEAVIHFMEAGASTLIFIGVVVILYRRQVTMREHAQSLATELAEANRQLEEYASEVEQLTLLTERQRMARELHDTLAQGLAGLVLQLEAAKNHMENQRFERAFEITIRAMSRARSALAESRAAIDDLRQTDDTRSTLPRAFQHRIERFRQATNIECQLVVDTSPEINSLPKPIIEHAERVLSEALFNITRHARASNVRVTVNYSENQLEIAIIDNGIGFDLEDVIQAGHYGLLGMRERIQQVNGTLEIKSKPGQGTQVIAVIPVRSEKE